jgi:glycosyltransferase involved in cell wall biosynthesis
MPPRICYPFVGDTVGGSHVSAMELISALPADKVEPLVLVHREGLLADYLRGRGIAFEHAPKIDIVADGAIAAQIPAMVRSAARLTPFLRRRRIDVVHTNDIRMHLSWGLAARCAGLKFIWHQRSADNSRRLATYSRLAHRVLTVSHYCKSQLHSSFGLRAKVVVNPFCEATLGLDREAARRRVLGELGAEEGARLIGFIGNLIERKRPLQFVEMAAKLQARKQDDLLFVMLGDPRQPERGMVESRIASLGLERRCVLTGMRFPIEPWIMACDVIVAPAVAEPFGRAVAEPMLLGTPVVAADDGGNPEILTNRVTGLLVRPDDPDAYATATAELLENRDFALTLSRNALEHARRCFSRQRHVEAILQIYAEETCGR